MVEMITVEFRGGKGGRGDRELREAEDEAKLEGWLGFVLFFKWLGLVCLP